MQIFETTYNSGRSLTDYLELVKHNNGDQVWYTVSTEFWSTSFDTIFEANQLIIRLLNK